MMAAKIAFFAPLKPPDHPIPSGDRQMARMFLHALGQAGFDTLLASRAILYSKRHGAEHMAARRQLAHAEAARLLAEFEERGWSPDLWFSYHPYDKSPDWLGEEICERLSIPFVAAEPCKTGQGPNGEWLPWRAESKRIIAKAAMSLVMTQSDLEFVSEFVPPQRIAWFDPFIDVDALEAEPVEKNPWPRDEVIKLLSVGMMRPGAKIDSYTVLSAALRHLFDLPWNLVIVGGGPGEPEVRAMFEGFPDGRVVFAGERPAGEVLTLMGMADVLAWPGCREAYGMVYLEAASHGVPAVALRNMGVPRVVEDGRTGLLADPSDSANYAACLRRLIVDPALRSSLGLGAKAFVEGERSGTAAALRLRHILDLVISDNRS
jgi:glycosyltransferase involved in cell wall biosynthesis